MAKKKKKREPLTIQQIAKVLGVKPNTVYQTIRTGRRRSNDPLRALHDLARQEGISRNVASRIIGVLKLDGVPAIKKLAGPDTERFVRALLTTQEKDVQEAIANSEKMRKKTASGVSARMSKAKV